MKKRLSTFKIDSFKAFINRQEGAIAVIVAAFALALFGFAALVVDLGASYNEASKLQNALDSATLAAVQDLPIDEDSDAWENKIVKVGKEYANYNNLVLKNSDFEKVINDNKVIGVKVNGRKVVNYTFARVLGINSGDINRSATAKLKTAKGVSNLIPLAIPKDTMDDIKDGIETFYLKGGPHDKEFFGNIGGWRGMWHPNDENWDKEKFVEYYKNGYPKEIYIGYQVIEKNGVDTAATDSAYYTRMTGHEHCSLSDMEGCPSQPKMCPRIVTAPIVKTEKGNLIVCGFASFFLEPAVMEDINKIKEIKATYIEAIVLPGSTYGEEAMDYGVYVPKLTD